MMEQERFEQWAIVSLFGHRQVAGLMSDLVIGGETFIRLDVPKADGTGWELTECYGKGAIYSFLFCTEETARIAAARLDYRPVTEWTVPDATRLLELDDGRLGDEVGL